MQDRQCVHKIFDAGSRTLFAAQIGKKTRADLLYFFAPASLPLSLSSSISSPHSLFLFIDFLTYLLYLFITSKANISLHVVCVTSTYVILRIAILAHYIFILLPENQ